MGELDQPDYRKLRKRVQGLTFVDSRVKPENDINFKAQSSSQTPPEHHGLCSTMLSTRRAPAVQVKPENDIKRKCPRMTVFQSAISHPARFGVPFANGLGFGAKSLTSLS